MINKTWQPSTGIRNGALASLLVVAGLFAHVAPVSADELTVEYQLALVQRNAYVAPDDPLVFRFGNVLDSLTSRCQESRLQLGNGAVNVVDQLQQQGVYTESPLSILEGLDEAVPVGPYGPDHPAKCYEFLGLLETLIAAGP